MNKGSVRRWSQPCSLSQLSHDRDKTNRDRWLDGGGVGGLWWCRRTFRLEEGALTRHLDPGRVSPECSSPAGLLGASGAAGGVAMASGIGWAWPSGLCGPRSGAGWPMITVQPAGAWKHPENTLRVGGFAGSVVLTVCERNSHQQVKLDTTMI